MLQTVIGRDGFRAGMDLYFQRHDGQAVTIEDFLAAFADANQIDLTQFKLWYSQAGTPEVTANGVYDAQQKTYTLTLSQSCPPTPGQPLKKPMVIPVRFGLVGQNGEDLAYERATGGRVVGNVIHLTDAKQTIVFHGVLDQAGSVAVPRLLGAGASGDGYAAVRSSSSCCAPMPILSTVGKRRRRWSCAA